MLSKETVIHLLQNPRKVADYPEDELRQLAEAYPYSQPLQLLYAARLRYSNEHLFQRQLGRTALITNDRSVLFELFEEEAPLQEQAQQVSESRERDEVKPAEWAPASRPKETAPEEEAIRPETAPSPPESAPNTPSAADESAPPASEPVDQPTTEQESVAEAPQWQAEETPKEEPPAEESSSLAAETTPSPEEPAPGTEKDRSSERPPRPTARESGQQLAQDQLSERMRAILEKNRLLRQRQHREQIQDEEAPPEESDSLEGKAPPEEAEASAGALLSKGELTPEPENTTTPEPEKSEETAARSDEASETASEATGPDPEDHPTSSTASLGETSPDDERESDAPSEGKEDSALDQEFLEIEALIDQYRQEDVPRLVDEPSTALDQEQSPAEEAESSSEERSSEAPAAEKEGQPHSFTYWLKRLSGTPPKAPSTQDETPASSSAAEASPAPSSSASIEDSPPAEPSRSSSSDEDRASAGTSAQASEEKEAEDLSMEDKLQLLDAFVEKLPELKKKKPGGPPPPEDKPAPNRPLKTPDRPKEVDGALVTETLAKVYIRQKHYKKAIQAYEILKLKYPEKSSFFAGRIAEIKELTNSK
ncbi:MAG: hypothetical protein RI842_00175 [Schleiferiaceae bacterium]|nr:hypothetical protein [Schleiferiaceae bacterium]